MMRRDTERRAATSAALAVLLFGVGIAYGAGGLSVSTAITTQTVAAGGSLTITGAATTTGTCNTATLAYTWDTDLDGVFEGSGASVTYSAAGADGPATDTIRVQVADTASTPCAAAATATITITITNVAPVLTASTVPSALTEGQTGTYSATATDPEGTLDPLSYAWTFGDAGTGTGASTTHSYADEGTYTVNLTVSDSDGGSAVLSPAATVTVTNADPIISSTTGTASGAEGATLSYACVATDPGASDTLSYVWTFSDTSSTATGATTTHAWRDNGTQTAQCTVTDGDGGSDSGTATSTISNVAPTLSSTTLPTTGDEGSSLAFTVTAADVGVADTFTYLWAFGDSSSATTQSPTHAYTDEGTYTIGLTVTDDDGGTVTTSGSVVISNLAPTATASGAGTATEGGSVTYTCVGSDPGSDTLSYSWAFSDGGTGTGSPLAHTWASQGTKTATCTTSDGDGGTDTDAVTTVVSNGAPVISAATIPSTGVEGTAVSVSVTAADPGGDPLTYAWTFGDGATATTAAATHAYADNGTYTIRLTVTDDASATDTDSGTVTISNAAPAVTASGASTGSEGVAITYTCVGSDPGSADTLTYRWTFSDGTTAATATASHTWATAGTKTATCTVTDDDGSSGTGSVTTVISAVAPTISALTVPTTGFEGGGLSFSATAVGSDPTESFSYAWSFGDGGTATTAAASHTYVDNATYTVQVTATDSDGLSVTQSRSLTVGNVAPTATITTGASAAEGTAVSLTCTGNDPGTADTFTYAWTFGDGATATGASASHAYADNGSYTVTCTITDDDGGAGSGTRTATISNVDPTLSGTPGAAASDAAAYSFTPTVTDPGTADTQSFTLTGLPAAATVSSAGVVSWSPTYADAGTYSVTLGVQDDDGGADSLSWTLTVSYVDTDGDGLSDAEELSLGTDPTLSDSDGDTLTDLEEVDLYGTDPRDRFSDSDGLDDAAELALGLDPTDGDMDDDGLTDDVEISLSTVPTACDTDGDGLADGLEEGLAAPDADTDLGAACFTADSDPSQTSDPLLADTDGDNLDDGDEDSDQDGELDPTETDPLLPDTDADSLDDDQERTLGTDGRDADSDEDGLTDGAEARSLGTDPLGCDTDGDGLTDGLERGVSLTTAPADTLTSSACFQSDQDTATRTDPLDSDSDDDSLEEGVEDADGDGAVDADEPDPGLADTDGDLVPDGEETDWDQDTDGDGDINALDTDADDDGLADGLEVAVGPRTPTGDDADGLLTAPLDTDADGLDDMVDDNDDADSAPTADEDPTLDTDGDGLVDYLDPDDDDDGFKASDCGRLDPTIYPGATEVIVDGIDQDCDGGDVCYVDADGDGYYVEAETVASPNTICGDDLGEARAGDVDGDGDADLGQDRDADGVLDYGTSTDGVSVDLPSDCDDTDPAIHPEAGDACEDYGTTQIDTDCDGDANTVSRWDDAGTPTDLSDDVYVTEAVTTDAFPFYEDKDYDGFGDEDAEPIFPCEPPTALTDAEKEAGVIAYVPSSGDCDDENAYVYPGADEVCNGLDEDCDDIADEPEDLGETSGCALSYSDHDLDGYGSDLAEDQLCLCFDGVPTESDACPEGDYELTADGTCYTDHAGDCYDYDAHIYEGAVERMDGDDNNCDGLIASVELDCDDDGSLPLRASEIGLGDEDAVTRESLGLTGACVEGAEIELECWGLPVRLTCNTDELWSANRNDEGVIDRFSGGSRVYASGRSTFTAGDCDDQCAARRPWATETCDGRDNDCDMGSRVVDDDGDGLINQIEVDADRPGRISPEELDLDGDGYVSCASVPTEDQTVVTYASCSTTVLDNALFADCNDLCALSSPVAEEERCDGFLDICDGAPEGSDQDEDGHGTCGLGGTEEGSALAEDVYALVWYTEGVAFGLEGSDKTLEELIIDGGPIQSDPPGGEGEIIPLLLPRPEAALCDAPLDAALTEKIGQDALLAAQEALVKGELADAVEPLLALCIEAQQDDRARAAGRCGVVRLSLTDTADDALLDEETLEALGQAECGQHPEQQTWRTVWSRERVLASRRLVQEWECYRSAGTFGCGDLKAPVGWVDADGPTPGGAFNHRVPDELLVDPEWWTELGRFSPAAVSTGILYGCWDPVEVDAREGQTVGGDCSDSQDGANREQPEGPGDLMALYSPELAELASCDRCLDGIDNNCDGTLDCADPTCASCFVGQGRGCADADSPCAQAGCAATPRGPLLPTGAAVLGLSLFAAGLRRRRR
jgi:PKD repeat protein